MLEEIKKTAAFIDAATDSFAPEVGVILGTGLGGFADKIETRFAIEYKDIPGFPVSTVEGHKGRMIFGMVEGRRVVAMQGRFHYYEGYGMQQVTFPVRVMRQLGIKYLFVSNASGGINTSFRVGDLMVITDHINLMPNPLIGPNIAELGPRFPDMHNCYDKELIAKATAIAEEENIKLQYGVYVGGTGPTFETQAEYQEYRRRCGRHVHRAGGDRGAPYVDPGLRRFGHHQLRTLGRSGRPRRRAASGQKGRNQDGGALQAYDKSALEGMSFRAVPVVLRRWTDWPSGFLSRTFAAESSGRDLDLHRCIPALAPGRSAEVPDVDFSRSVVCLLIILML